MVHVHTLLFIGLLEAFAACAVALGVVAFVAWRRRRRDRGAIAALVESVKSREPERRDALSAVLASGGRTQAAIDAFATRVERDRKVLIRDLIAVYSSRDAAAFQALEQPVHTLVYGLLEELASAPASGEAAEPDAGADVGDVAALRERNESLETELRITRETMRNMLEEYARGADAPASRSADEPEAPADGSTESADDADIAVESGPVEVAGAPETDPPRGDILDDFDEPDSGLGDFELDLGKPPQEKREGEPA